MKKVGRFTIRFCFEVDTGRFSVPLSVAVIRGDSPEAMRKWWNIFIYIFAWQFEWLVLLDRKDMLK